MKLLPSILLELNKGRSLAEFERNEFGVNLKRLVRLKYKRINNKFIERFIDEIPLEGFIFRKSKYKAI